MPVNVRACLHTNTLTPLSRPKGASNKTEKQYFLVVLFVSVSVRLSRRITNHAHPPSCSIAFLLFHFVRIHFPPLFSIIHSFSHTHTHIRIRSWRAQNPHPKTTGISLGTKAALKQAPAVITSKLLFTFVLLTQQLRCWRDVSPPASFGDSSSEWRPATVR